MNIQNGAAGWQIMSTAPHDGTPVEIRCTYGVAPWYGLYRWTATRSLTDNEGAHHEYESEPTWVKVGDDASSFSSFNESATFHWRPYTGDPAAYVDPTGGFQDDPKYWRQAVARKYGINPEILERIARRNSLKNKARGFFARLFK